MGCQLVGKKQKKGSLSHSGHLTENVNQCAALVEINA